MQPVPLLLATRVNLVSPHLRLPHSCVETQLPAHAGPFSFPGRQGCREETQLQHTRSHGSQIQLNVESQLPSFADSSVVTVCVWRLSSRHTCSHDLHFHQSVESRLPSLTDSSVETICGKTQLPSHPATFSYHAAVQIPIFSDGLTLGCPFRVHGVSLFPFLPPADLGTVVRLQDSASRRSRISASGFRHHTRHTNSFIHLSSTTSGSDHSGSRTQRRLISPLSTMAWSKLL